MKTLQFFNRVRRYFVPGDFRRWLTVFIPTCLSLIFIVSTGPSVQTYVMSIITSNATSIYASAYKDEMNQFLSLKDWIVMGCTWYIVVTAIAISLFSLRQPSARKVLASAIVSSFVALTISDVVLHLVAGSFTGGKMFENVIANFFGAIMIALVLLAILLGSDFCRTHTQGKPFLRHMFAATFTIVAGLLVLIFVFYVAKLFYEPVPVKLDVFLDSPMNGQFASVEKDRVPKEPCECDDKSKSEPFQLLRNLRSDSGPEWTAPDELLDVSWRLPNPGESYNASIDFYTGCSTTSVLENTAALQTVQLDNIKTLDIKFDNGFTEFEVLKKEKDSDAKTLVNVGELTHFWTDRNEDSKKIKITQFTADKATIEQSDLSSPISFYLTGALANVKDTKLAFAPRILSLNIDGNLHKIKFTPLNGNLKKKIECKTLPSRDIFNEQASSTSELYVGVAVTLTKTASHENLFMEERNKIKVSSKGGWISLRNINEDDLTRTRKGWITMLHFKGNVAALSIDGEPAVVRPFETYYALGEMQGSFEDSGRLRFYGYAKSFFKDSSRANPTKWERLGWEPRILMLGILGTLFTLLGRFITVHIKQDTEIQGIESDWKLK